MSEDIVTHEDIFSRTSNATYQIGYKDIRSNKSFVSVRPRGNFSRGVVTLHKKDALEQVVIDKELHDKLVKAAKTRAAAVTRKRKRGHKVDSDSSVTTKVPKKRKPGRPKGSRTVKREEGTDVGSCLRKVVPRDDTSLDIAKTDIPSVKTSKGRPRKNGKQQRREEKEEKEVESQGYSSSASLGSIPPSENEDTSDGDDDNESDTDYHTDADELGPELTAATSSDYDEYDNDNDDDDFYLGKRSGQNGKSKRVSFRSQRSGTKATTVAMEEGRRTRRGRPKKLGSDSVIESPATPRKLAPKTDHQFSSPLRRVIRDNLREYRDTTASMQLTLSKNFVPTPLPTNIDHEYIQNLQRNRQENDFFDTFEGYLSQRKMVKRADKPRSKNTMALAPEITREEFALVTNLFNENFHKRTRETLFQIQRKMFPQYWFELTQGFSLLFYGIGSKRQFLERFALEYLVPRLSQSTKGEYGKRRSGSSHNTSMTIPCIIVNGYNPSCVYREVFRAVSKIMFPQEIYGDDSKFWGNLCMLQVQRMIEFYKDKPPDIKLVLLVHNIDGPGVRKEMFQTLLSSLGVIRQIALIASADHIYAPVLWDNMKSQNYNFVYHDITDYAPVLSSLHSRTR